MPLSYAHELYSLHLYVRYMISSRAYPASESSVGDLYYMASRPLGGQSLGAGLALAASA